MVSHPSEYRRHAHRSRELAELAQSAEERDLLEEMARHWDALADAMERLRKHGHEPE